MTTVSTSTQGRPLRSALLVLIAAWIATEAISALSECLISGAADQLPTAVVAVFSGEFERSAPVYRLPSITVAAKRSLPTAEAGAPKRIAREPQSTPGRNTRSPS